MDVHSQLKPLWLQLQSRNLLIPPYDGTIFISGNIITHEDTSTYDSVIYAGIASRTMQEEAVELGLLLSLAFFLHFLNGPNIEIQINPEFTREEALLEAIKYAFLIEQLPIALRRILKQ